MVGTAKSATNFLRVAEQIMLEEIKEQAHGYFELLRTGNIIDSLPSSLTVKPLSHLYNNNETQKMI